MKSFSHRSVNLRGSLTVAVAMLVVLDHALNQPNAIWFKVLVAMILAGAIAARAFMDQSLSMRDKSTSSDAAIPDVAASAPVGAPPILNGEAARKAFKDAPAYPFN